MSSAPIALFTYCRPDHTRRTIEALQRNALAAESDLVVFSDAARTSQKTNDVDEVRDYLSTIQGFKSVTIRRRDKNFGLSRSIIEGVAEVLQRSEKVIVLEDDMVTSPHFLSYMNDALDRYEKDDRVASIHGYVYPVRDPLPEAFFIAGADCWSWATWRRAWRLFNPDGQLLLDELKQRKLVRAFDFNGAYGFTDMLEAQIRGENDSWAIRWYASAFLAGKLTLYPGRSLVQNIGNDDTGTHGGNTTYFDGALSDTPIDLNDVPVEVSRQASQAFENFLRKSTSRPRRLLRKFSALKKTRLIQALTPPKDSRGFPKSAPEALSDQVNSNLVVRRRSK